MVGLPLIMEIFISSFILQNINPQAVLKVSPSHTSALIGENILIEIRISYICTATIYINTQAHNLYFLSMFTNISNIDYNQYVEYGEVSYFFYLSPKKLDYLSTAFHCFLIDLFFLRSQLEPRRKHIYSI